MLTATPWCWPVDFTPSGVNRVNLRRALAQPRPGEGDVPANRSRTERWRESLHQIYERNGGLEISLKRKPGAAEGPDLLWRVRLMGINDQELLVESPAAAGKSIAMVSGAELVVVMAVGQNRWMFHSKVLESTPGGLRLAMPEHVERCQRRDFMRISTAAVNPARVQCWRLLDPASVVAAEIANKGLVLDLENGVHTRPAECDVETMLLPTVGPGFHARLINIGGGGVGLLVDKSEASALDRCRYVWMKIDLRPEIPAPIGLTARLVHVHTDHEQNVYAGLAFEFSFNAGHRDFVVSQIGRYVGAVQARHAA
jgi:c-di-GMP-binding flagellar brake protein YcgR